MKKAIALVLFGLLLAAWEACASPRQDHAAIRAAIEEFVRDQTLGLQGQAGIKVGEIDRRVALPACTELEVYLPAGGQLAGNTTVGVRCPAGALVKEMHGGLQAGAHGKKGWALFVPVQIRISADMLIARRPLLQGQVLGEDDFVSQSGELTQPGTLTDPSQAIGKVLRFGVGAGQALRQEMLRPPYAVAQGQTVQLQVTGQGYRVHSEGQALGNAAEGQSLRVKAPSGQVVSGMALRDGSVEVSP